MRKLWLVAAVLGVMTVAVYLGKKQAARQVEKPPVAEWTQPVRPTEKKSVMPTEAVNWINEAEIKKNLEYLCSAELEGRMSGKQGNVKAAAFIKAYYESLGLNTMYHKFSIRRQNPGPKNENGDNFTQNIYAWVDGSDLASEVIVVGAHMDHIGYGPQMSQSRKIAIHPGADDNASGTVALMGIAKAFSKLKPRRTVVFMSFSAEEMGLLGAKYYCSDPQFPKSSPSLKNHVFMLNMDMVGYLGKNKTAVSLNSSNSSPDVDGMIGSLIGKYPFAKSITSRGSGGSDHAAFYNKGIPVASLFTGMHSYYHTPDDTPDKINYSGLEQVAKYGFELSWQLAQADQRPKFNVSSFSPMSETHDHSEFQFER